MTRIGVVGSINTDYVVRTPRFPAPGETLIGNSFEVYGGGKGANQAIAAARLGAEVEFFGAAGRDSQSRERVEQMAADGVGTSNIFTFDGHGGIAMIQVEERSGQNAITLIPGANMLLNADETSACIEKWIRPGDLFCMQLEVPFEVIHATLSLAQRHGLRAVLNAAPFDSRVIDVLSFVDVLIVNEIEAGQLLGRDPIRVDQAPASAARLLAFGIGTAAIITLGAEGAVLADREGSLHSAAPTVTAVDTTGAGDAFVGACCAALASGANTRTAMHSAVYAGSLAVQRHGAQPSLPTVAELERALTQSF